MKPIPDVTTFIAALVVKSAAALAALDERRHQLLAHHLGFEPKCPVEPVYVLGDSHTLFFAGEDGMNQVKHRRVGFWRPRYITRGLDLLPCFHTRHLGPATAWRAFDYGSSTRSREKIDALVRHEFKPGDRVLLFFGEIDCRCHIPKIALAGNLIAPGVHKTVERFLELMKHLKSRDLQVAVWGPAMVINSDQTVVGNPLPTIGSYELRATVIQAYCHELGQGCASLKIPCVCLAGTYHEWNKPAAPQFFADGFHLSQCLMPDVLRVLRDKGVLTLSCSDAAQTLADPAQSSGEFCHPLP